ncbi:hypothetical protein K469DRAFT_211999 [Zopfia rhizophila CBS 207.26]|uniref:Uncharacterized protein n=1 Tax=Zopfia rhizophila CBS 207.26 TaxID=1314779 RepID=A0A6A6DTK3_9PEZI|nr:hypothetical protein K469DRAFT_211999 [Zopfia rhizophila CBS 207.26]
MPMSNWQYKPREGVFKLNYLHWYLASAIPLTVVVFLMWVSWLLYANHKQRKNNETWEKQRAST